MISKAVSFIENGTLRVRVTEPTWFQFLQFSRATNSENGGWNFKTHWETGGLDAFILPAGEARAFLTEWTKRSLKNATRPTPRERDFRVAERLEAFAKDSRRPAPGTENEINWKTFSSLAREGCRATYELPLAGEQEGQLKVDVACFIGNGCVELIELKRSGEKAKDTPLMALTELICYSLQLVRCWGALRKDLLNVYREARFDPGSRLKELTLTIAAPNYWKARACGRQIRKMEAILTAVSKVTETKGVTLRLRTAEINAETGVLSTVTLA